MGAHASPVPAKLPTVSARSHSLGSRGSVMLSASIKNELFPASAALEGTSLQSPQQPLVPKPLNPLPGRQGGPQELLPSRDPDPWGGERCFPLSRWWQKPGLWEAAGGLQAFQGAGCSSASSRGHILKSLPGCRAADRVLTARVQGGCESVPRGFGASQGGFGADTVPRDTGLIPRPGVRIQNLAAHMRAQQVLARAAVRATCSVVILG